VIDGRMKVLTFSTLYPNAAQPVHGLFVEHRLLNLVSVAGVQARVVAPVPWFPSGSTRFGQYGAFGRAPRREQRGGLEVCHPRFPVLPKVGMTLAPFLMASWVRPALEAIRSGGFDFDLIDAHYYYPDGIAAVMLGRATRKPVVITARGSDINEAPRHALPARMIRWAFRQAAASVAVCQALKDRMVELGADAQKVHVLRNGVDLDLFHLVDRAQARQELGLSGEHVLLCVGQLRKLKGHELVIRALPDLPGWHLVIVGEGECREELRALAHELGLADRVRFAGAVPQSRLPTYYGAADALVLASSSEGLANVILESLACGTPVVATRVGGAAEVLTVPEAGQLVDERTPRAIGAAVNAVNRSRAPREAVRRHAGQFSWAATARGQLHLFEQVLGGRA
jgi:teichuronic acid biosynthesis glycosyltransferase TuaC